MRIWLYPIHRKEVIYVGDPVTVVVVYKKATKNTFQYKEALEPGDPSVIGTIYVQKHVLGSQPPTRLTITISAVKE